jgi:hypothetical protein
MVFPIALGSGMRFFGEAADATTLKLVDTRPLEVGAVILACEPAKPAETG